MQPVVVMLGWTWDSSIKTQSGFFFPRRCSSGTWLYFYAVYLVSRQIDGQIAHQISLVPPANPADPNPSSRSPFSVAAGMMQPSLSL
jgi:hypothetical protein